MLLQTYCASSKKVSSVRSRWHFWRSYYTTSRAEHIHHSFLCTSKKHLVSTQHFAERSEISTQLNTNRGRTAAQAVSRWLPTTAAPIRARVWSSGIFGWQSGADFLRVLRFPLPIFIPPNSPSSHSPRAGTIGQKWPTCQVDPVWTPPPTMRIKKKELKS
jgi:hypothetical protein